MQQRWSSFTEACAATWTAPELQSCTALEFAGERIAYPDLAVRTDRLAAALRAAGVRRGDLVALAMERSLDTVVALFAVMWAGGCPCPLEPRLSVEETDTRLSSVGIGWVLFDPANAEHAARLGLPAERKVLACAGASVAWRDEGLSHDDRALLLFTSGSTGRPKGVLLSHGNLLSNAAGVIAHTGLTGSDRLLHTMPIYHTNGLNNQLFAPLLAGSQVIFAGRFRADEMPALLDEYRPTVLTGVPTMYSRMLDQAFSAASLKQLRMARCGSAPITEDLHRKVESKLGCPLVVSYGLSEATCTSVMNPPDRRKVGTVGTVLEGQTVKLLQPGGTDEVGSGGEGEVAIAGPNLMIGYLGADPDANRAITDGWLRTGDLGRFDEDGYLSITGRIKEVIIRGGENLSPLAIEKVIAADPSVAACCVVGRPDADLGEVPVAFVVPSGAAAPDLKRIQDLVTERLSRIYRPEDVYVVGALPETAVGKVDRKSLAAMARSC
jgi:acyl-CoA synthetase (AMP-forming)/AMP-acid ligase II